MGLKLRPSFFENHIFYSGPLAILNLCLGEVGGGAEQCHDDPLMLFSNELTTMIKRIVLLK